MKGAAGLVNSVPVMQAIHRRLGLQLLGKNPNFVLYLTQKVNTKAQRLKEKLYALVPLC